MSKWLPDTAAFYNNKWISVLICHEGKHYEVRMTVDYAERDPVNILTEGRWIHNEPFCFGKRPRDCKCDCSTSPKLVKRPDPKFPEEMKEFLCAKGRHLWVINKEKNTAQEVYNQIFDDPDNSPFGQHRLDHDCDCESQKEVKDSPAPDVCKYATPQPLPENMPVELRYLPTFYKRNKPSTELSWGRKQKIIEMQQAYTRARSWVQRNMREWPICEFGHTVQLSKDLSPGKEITWVCNVCKA